MTENIKLTRISDLPNSYLNMPTVDDAAAPYLHANPYGQSPPVGGMPPPVAQGPKDLQQFQQNQQHIQNNMLSQPQQHIQNNMLSQNQQHIQNNMLSQNQQQFQQNPYANQLSADQIALLQQMPQQSLPSRDIPQDTTGYTQDARSNTPNYVPPPQRADDYIAKYERDTEAKTVSYEKEKRREREVENTLDRIQMPIFLFVLYYIFEMPVFTNIFRRFSFLGIYNDLGNLNMNGILLKSVMFAATFFSFDSAIKYLADL